MGNETTGDAFREWVRSLPDERHAYRERGEIAGIGSEVYQAVKLGRRGIGVELKKSYFDLAIRNLMILEESSKQMGLFDGEATD